MKHVYIYYPINNDLIINTYDKFKKSYPISDYFTEFLWNLHFKDERWVENKFIVCAGYETAIKKDFQFSVTGSSFFDEKTIDTIDRELGEEIGLKLQTINPFLTAKNKKITFNCMNVLYGKDVVNLSDDDCKNEDIYRQGHDDKFNKISVCIAIDENNIERYVDNVCFPESGVGEVHQIIMIPFEFLKNIFESTYPSTYPSTRRKRRYDWVSKSKRKRRNKSKSSKSMNWRINIS